MVIEVSKELDVVRIGIDRYSLKTGCNLRSIMDVSLRVIKEPRGFIRIIQCVMAILAFSTTAGFSAECKFTIECASDKPNGIKEVEYEFGYPFSNTKLSVPRSCEHLEDPLVDLELPYDLSNASEFFVATGVISFLYTLVILVVYIFFHQTYTNNTKIPVVDLGMTTMLTVFWMGGSSAWAQGVADLKSYLHPDTVFKFLIICTSNDEAKACRTDEDGSFGLLNGSLILGFANFILWAFSLWFIYKETVFHTPEVSDPSENQTTKPVGRV
ncbi:hypothetical protein JTE90_009362 [Oedothorax gibbosus]|uniref:MARVEL domain-containing protein n=1 Tax=Oedothorax gibbosus TaxID=931172 RepID=A0AAV6VUR5_9ARAC|nr:hypothetical protein JTE90_009362 [Oedothorax gibbosus]